MSKVAIVMGSNSDMPVMQDAIDILKGFDIEKALKFATITSALVATGLGSDAGIKSFKDSLEKMNNLKHK